MAEDATQTAGRTPGPRSETAALRNALAAEHAAVWGYGVVGAALPAATQPTASAAEAAHRDLRDRLTALLEARKAEPVPAKAGYALPFPVLSPVDAAALAVVLEDGTERAWVDVMGRAVKRDVRKLGADALAAAEVRAVAWRVAAGKKPVTSPFPGLPA